MKQQGDYKRIFKKYFKDIYRIIGIDSDKDPGDIIGEELEEREKLYTSLLSNYSFITHIRNIAKEIHKWLFFWAIVVGGGFLISFACRIMNKVLGFEDAKLFIDSVPVLLAALVSFISALISIPVTIAKFLFNEKEDDNITQIINHTQDHDSVEIKLLKHRYSPNEPREQPYKKGEAPPETDDLDELDSDTGT